MAMEEKEARLEKMRHSAAHVMAEAICGIWPKAKLVYGPIVEDGFYYDFDFVNNQQPTTNNQR
jgi:threonyl-tRNA synthetase